MFDFSPRIRSFHFPRQKVSHDKSVFVRCSFRKNVRVKNMMWHHETQSSRKGVCVVVCNAVEFVMFHIRQGIQNTNGSKVRKADI